VQRNRFPIGKILDYGLAHVSQSTVRRAFGKWRAEQGIPLRCDNASCQLHTVNPLWNSKPITMVLDHVDGNRKNNRPSNLRFLCANCDSQLLTRGGGNKGRIRNATADSYHVVERDGRLEVKAMLTGVSAVAKAGNVGVELAEP
jgi:hypothetical protein